MTTISPISAARFGRAVAEYRRPGLFQAQALAIPMPTAKQPLTQEGGTYQFTVRITQAMVNAFRGVSGDNNPVHHDSSHPAAKATLEFLNARQQPTLASLGPRQYNPAYRPIVHGMYLGSLFSAGLAQGLGDGVLYTGQDLKFLKPVPVGSTVTVSLTTEKVEEKRGKGTAYTVKTEIHLYDDMAVSGKATLFRPTSDRRPLNIT